MKLENQVVSLELAKKLKELGVEQESYFDWYLMPSSNYPTNLSASSKLMRKRTNDFCSAFTVAELGEMLPARVHTKEKNNWYPIEAFGKNVYGEYLVAYHNDFEAPLHQEIANTEADARAKLLIYLIENGLTK